MNDTTKIPLCIDLDGTFYQTDLTQEALLVFIKKYFFSQTFLKLISKLFISKACFKQFLQSKVQIDLLHLPINNAVIDFIKKAQEEERDIYLVTGQDEIVAKKVSEYFPYFKNYYASNGKINLVDKEKAQFLDNQFGFKQYDYVGNSSQDYTVWQHCKNPFSVHVSGKTLHYAKTLPLSLTPPNIFIMIFQLFSVKHWIIPFIIFSFIYPTYTLSSSLIISSLSIFKKLKTLEEDRKDPKKYQLPLSQGYFSIFHAFILMILLMIGGLCIII